MESMVEQYRIVMCCVGYSTVQYSAKGQYSVE